MNRLPLLLLALLVSTGIPLGAAAQDADGDAEQGRYDAAIAWANLVMVENDFEQAAAQANEAVVSQMTAQVLEDAWSQVRAQIGDLESLEPVEQGMAEGFHVVMLAGEFERGAVDVQVVMADDHTIAGFFIRPAGG